MDGEACLNALMQMAQKQADAMSEQSKYEERCTNLQKELEEVTAESEKWQRSALSWQRKYEKETSELKSQIQKLDWQIASSGMHVTVQENNGLISGSTRGRFTKQE